MAYVLYFQSDTLLHTHRDVLGCHQPVEHGSCRRPSPQVCCWLAVRLRTVASSLCPGLVLCQMEIIIAERTRASP